MPRGARGRPGERLLSSCLPGFRAAAAGGTCWEPVQLRSLPPVFSDPLKWFPAALTMEAESGLTPRCVLALSAAVPCAPDVPPSSAARLSGHTPARSALALPWVPVEGPSGAQPGSFITPSPTPRTHTVLPFIAFQVVCLSSLHLSTQAAVVIVFSVSR